MKLTESIAKTFPMPPGKREHVEWDDEIAGFGLRLRRAKPDALVTRRLVFQYGDRKLTFGDPAALNFAATRKAASQAYAKVKLGQDPQADKAAARRAARERFGVVAARWLEEREKEGCERKKKGRNYSTIPMAITKSIAINRQIPMMAPSAGWGQW